MNIDDISEVDDKVRETPKEEVRRTTPKEAESLMARWHAAQTQSDHEGMTHKRNPILERARHDVDEGASGALEGIKDMPGNVVELAALPVDAALNVAQRIQGKRGPNIVPSGYGKAAKRGFNELFYGDRSVKEEPSVRASEDPTHEFAREAIDLANPAYLMSGADFAKGAATVGKVLKAGKKAVVGREAESIPPLFDKIFGLDKKPSVDVEALKKVVDEAPKETEKVPLKDFAAKIVKAPQQGGPVDPKLLARMRSPMVLRKAPPSEDPAHISPYRGLHTVDLREPKEEFWKTYPTLSVEDIEEIHKKWLRAIAEHEHNTDSLMADPEIPPEIKEFHELYVKHRWN